MVQISFANGVWKFASTGRILMKPVPSLQPTKLIRVKEGKSGWRFMDDFHNSLLCENNTFTSFVDLTHLNFLFPVTCRIPLRCLELFLCAFKVKEGHWSKSEIQVRKYLYGIQISQNDYVKPKTDEMLVFKNSTVSLLNRRKTGRRLSRRNTLCLEFFWMVVGFKTMDSR